LSVLDNIIRPIQPVYQDHFFTSVGVSFYLSSSKRHHCVLATIAANVLFCWIL